MLGAHALGADLAPKVHLQGGVDGDHIVVLADDLRVVHIVHRQQLNGRVVIDIVIDPLGAVGKGGDALAPVDLLFAVVDGAAFDQLHHGVGKHLGMDAQVVLGFEGHAGGVGDGADAQLDAGPVRNLLGDQVADGDADLIQGHRGQHGQGEAVFHNGVHLADMDLGAADGPGLFVIDLHIDAFGLVDHGLGIGGVVPQAEIAMLVHGGHGHAEGVIAVAAADMAGNIPVIGGDKVRPAAVDRLSGPAAGEPGVAGHLPGQAVIGIKGEGVHVQQSLHLDIPQFTVPHPGGKGIHQCGGLGGAGIHAKGPAALQGFRQLFRRGQLRLVHLVIVHGFLLPLW